MAIDEFSLSATQADAHAHWRRFRLVLTVALAVHILLGLLALLVPRMLAIWLGLAADAGWIRALGAALLGLAMADAAGLLHRLRGRWAVVAGILQRLLLALVGALAGGGLLILAAIELGLALALSAFYLRFVKAELMSRP
jgi:hypothetical protein